MSLTDIRKLRKKLRQIEKLERLDRALTSEESSKVHSKRDVRLLLQQLTAENSEGLSTCVLGDISSSVSNDSSAEPAMTDVPAVASSTIVCQDSNSVSLVEDEDNEVAPSSATSAAQDTAADGLSNVARNQPVPVPEVSPEHSEVSDEEDKLEHSCSFVVNALLGHNGSVRSMSLVGDYLVTGSQDTTVKVWSLSAGVELKSFGGHTQPISAVLMLSLSSSRRLWNRLRECGDDSLDDDKSASCDHLILSVALDCTIRLWCFQSGACVKSVYTFHPLTSLSFIESKSIVVCGTDGGKLELWDLAESSEPVESCLAHQDAITCIVVDDNYVYCGSADGLLSIFQWTQSDNCLSRHYESTDAKSKTGAELSHRHIHCIAVFNGLVYYGDEAMNIKVLNWQTGVVDKLSNHTTEFGSTRSLCIANGLLVSSGYDLDNGIGYLNVRSAFDGRYLYTLCDVQTGYIQSVVCRLVDNGQIAIVTGGQELKTWLPRGNDATFHPTEQVVRSVYVPWFGKEARHSDSESDSDDEDSDSSCEPSLPWHQSQQPATANSWLSWCSLL